MSKQGRRKSPTSRDARRAAIDAKRGSAFDEDAVRRYAFLYGDVFVDRDGNLIDPARVKTS